MRLNKQAFKKCLKTDGLKYWFHSFDGNQPTYDPDTQKPIYGGTNIQHFADILDFTINEIENAGGLINNTSKKFVVLLETDLKIGDKVLNDSLVETHEIVFVNSFANRKHLFVNLISENPTDYSP